MLKLLYKTLLVSVLSGSLLMLDFSYKGVMLNSLHAESVKTEKISDSNLMGTLTMTVVGVLAKRLYTYKPTTDIMLAAAGGAIFIAGEGLAFFKLKGVMKGMEEQITRDKNGNVNKEQIESIERLKKSYEEAKKTATTKKNLQLAAAAAFAAAAVAAYTMTVGDLAALKTCTAGIGSGLSASGAVKAICKGLASSPPTAAEGARCYAELASCTIAIKDYSRSVTSYELARQSVGPSAPGLATANSTQVLVTTNLAKLPATCMSFTKSMAAPVQACQPLVPKNLIGESGGLGLTQAIGGSNVFKDLPDVYKQEFLKQNISDRQIANIIGQNTSVPDNLMMKVVDFFFPQAKAMLFSAMGIASKLAVSYLKTTSATIGPAIDMYMLIPQKRAIVWGVLSGLTATATMSTNNVITQIDSNIEKIEEILKSMYSMADGATGTQVAPIVTVQSQVTIASRVNAAPNAVNYEDVDLSNVVKGNLPCATGDENSKCKSFEDSVKDLPSYQGLENETKMQMDSIFKTASGLSGTSKITSGTMESAAKLAGQSSAIKSSMNKARSLVSGKLKDSGSSANLDADTKKLSDQIEKAMNDNLKNSNSSAHQMASHMSGATREYTTSTDLDADKKAKEIADAEAAALLEKNRAAAEAALAAGSIDLNAGTSDIMPAIANVDSGSTKELSPEELAAYNESLKKAAGNIDEFEIKNDISKDSGANIFELISNRYQQSGYPRLFKVKDPTATTTTEAVKN
jgi:hypothetical protein